MEDKKEISEEEYYRLKDLLYQAEKNLQAYHEKRGRYWIKGFHYFFSISRIPCIYNAGSIVPCVYTGEQIQKFKKLPKGFNKGKDYTFDTCHFSPKGCPNLTMKDSVLCLHADNDGKFFFGKHKVGKCPHKKVK
jgi:hypothetical protein